MNYNFLLFSFLIIIIVSFLWRGEIEINTKCNINLNHIKQISSFLSNCKNVTSFKNLKITTNKDVDIYLNYLSCRCKGIGFWGGFCLDKENKEVGYNYAHDEKLAYTLGKLLKNKRVADFGAGLGWYCPIIKKYSKVCDEYDGSVNIEEVTNGRIKYLNLAEPINIKCNYDFIISIEVAEHIPKEYETIYLNNLIKCAKESIIITWATIGQTGHFHINNKAKEDVIKLFESKGLKYNEKSTNKIAYGTSYLYLKRNIMVYDK